MGFARAHNVHAPGSCAITYEKAIDGPVTEEHAYFAKTLELHNQCNVLVSPALSVKTSATVLSMQLERLCMQHNPHTPLSVGIPHVC